VAVPARFALSAQLCSLRAHSIALCETCP
jgi:hypothetical protein